MCISRRSKPSQVLARSKRFFRLLVRRAHADKGRLDPATLLLPVLIPLHLCLSINSQTMSIARMFFRSFMSWSVFL